MDAGGNLVPWPTGSGNVDSVGALGQGPSLNTVHTNFTDFCIQFDTICDARSSSVIWNLVRAAFDSRIHKEGYQTCCENRNWRTILGAELLTRMMWPPLPDEAPPPTPPSGSPTVTSVNGLPDGTVLVTSDTRRMYKMVGGAPIWLGSCANGLCPNPRPTTQAVINAGPAVPRDSATARDEAGNVFKFVGGAPIHLSSCSVGCGNPVPITAWSIQTLDHMRPVPGDGATAKDEAGNIFEFAGGAPIHLASCAVGCGNPVPITAWSIRALEHMRPVPADGTTVTTENGYAYVFAGGAPLRLAQCEDGCGAPLRISGASIANLDHMRAVPADNTTVRTETGAVYKFAGGAPLWLSDCGPGCGDPVNITQWTIDNREHMQRLPVDGTALRTSETGTLFLTRGGEADLAGQCPSASGCNDKAVAVNQVSVDPIAHGVANRGPAYGVLCRYFNGADHYTTTGGVPAGYRLEYAFGQLSRTAAEGTRPLYACRTGTDTFTSHSDTCEGTTKIGRLGWIYTSPPANRPSQALYRCMAANNEHFDSISSTCEGRTVEFQLGYVLAYAPLTRYFDGTDHLSAVAGVPAGYQPERTFGLLPLVSQPGTLPLYACKNGGDTFLARDANCEGEHFTSTSADCEGKTLERSLGYLVARTILSRAMRGSDHRTATGVLPAGYRHEHSFGLLAATGEPGTHALYACRAGTDDFTSHSPDCENQTIVGRLGWIWQQPPPGTPSVRLFRCKVTGTAEHFESTGETCEGHGVEFPLGHLRLEP